MIDFTPKPLEQEAREMDDFSLGAVQSASHISRTLRIPQSTAKMYVYANRMGALCLYEAERWRRERKSPMEEFRGYLERKEKESFFNGTIKRIDPYKLERKVAPEGDPNELQVHEDGLELLEKVLEDLTEEERRVAHLRIVEGMSYRAVGQLIGGSHTKARKIAENASRKVHTKAKSFGYDVPELIF